MIGNNGMARALNLDENEIAVTIGGRGFVLKQQPKKPLMRVLDAIFQQDVEEIEAAKTEAVALEDNIAHSFMKEWDKALPAIAMMFGHDPKQEDTWTEVVQFLEDNLAPMSGVKIFKAWWTLNEIDSFFMRCGRTMIHPEMEVGIESELKKQLAARVRVAMDTALQAQEESSE